MFLAFVLACTNAPDPVCADGYVLSGDSLCYPVDEVTPADEVPEVEDILDALPECEAIATDGRLDVDAGCADGACAGMAYVDMAAALGGTPECRIIHFDFDGYVSDSADCVWPGGIGGTFEDADHDGLPDPESTTYSVDVEPPFDGGTVDGMSLGVGLTCFVAALGDPDAVSFDLVGRDYVFDYAYWVNSGVSASDSYNAAGDYEPDGVVDAVRLYGAGEF